MREKNWVSEAVKKGELKESVPPATANIEGRGRFPGQDKFDVQVGGYGSVRNTNAATALSNAIADQSSLLTALGSWKDWDDAEDECE